MFWREQGWTGKSCSSWSTSSWQTREQAGPYRYQDSGSTPWPNSQNDYSWHDTKEDDKDDREFDFLDELVDGHRQPCWIWGVEDQEAKDRAIAAKDADDKNPKEKETYWYGTTEEKRRHSLYAKDTEKRS